MALMPLMLLCSDILPVMKVCVNVSRKQAGSGLVLIKCYPTTEAVISLHMLLTVITLMHIIMVHFSLFPFSLSQEVTQFYSEGTEQKMINA